MSGYECAEEDQIIPFEGIIDLYKELKYIGPFEKLTVSDLLRFIYTNCSMAALRKKKVNLPIEKIKKSLKLREQLRKRREFTASLTEDKIKMKVMKVADPNEIPLTLSDNIEDDYSTVFILPAHERSIYIPYSFRKKYQDVFDLIFEKLTIAVSAVKEKQLTKEDCWDFMYVYTYIEDEGRLLI